MHTAQLQLSTETNINVMASLIKAKETVIAWAAKYHQRRQLAKLDDRMLKDIGLTREQARKESEKCFWE